jgi:hypothetical protein
MIWRILGLIGAGSFFVNGFSLLSDPSCVSADFGGGRVIQVTCRGDSYGTFSGTQAGLISLFIGAGLLTLIFFNQIKQFFSKPKFPSEWKNVSIGNPEGLVDVKVCNYCEVPVSEDLQECPACKGTYFNHKKVSPARSIKLETKIEIDSPENQTKKCPMCAEEIKFEAMKCRFCQHSFIETGVQKFNSTASGFLSKALSKQFLPLTVILLVIGLVGLGFGLNARSNSIERNQLFASGEICVESKDGTRNYGCADYPNYTISFCSDAARSEIDFSESTEPLTERKKAGSSFNSCSPEQRFSYKFEGTIDKLIGDYELDVWDYSISGGDVEFGAAFRMKVRLNE